MSNTTLYLMVGLLLGTAFVTLAVRLSRDHRQGRPLHLLPHSRVGQMTALVFGVASLTWAIATGQLGNAVIPTVALAGITGAAADRLYDRSQRTP